MFLLDIQRHLALYKSPCLSDILLASGIQYGQPCEGSETGSNHEHESLGMEYGLEIRINVRSTCSRRCGIG